MKNCNEKGRGTQSAGGRASAASAETRSKKIPEAHKEKKTLVLPDGSAAAQEAQEEQHAAHSQDDVDAGEEQGVGRYDFPESRGIHQHPHSHSQQEGAPQLMEDGDKTGVR